MPSRRRSLLLAAACLATGADARFGRGGGPASSMAMVGGSLRRHHRRAASGAPRHRRDVDAAIIAALRGGGSGIEPNPEYEESVAENDECGDDSSSSDGADDEEGVSDDTSDDEAAEEEEDIDANGIASKLLSRTKLYRHSKSGKALGSKSAKGRLLAWARENQYDIIAVLGVIAFRKDIMKIPAYARMVRYMEDFKINWTTDVLKLILVAEVVRRYFLPPGGDSVLNEDEDDEEEDAVKGKNRTQHVEQSAPPSKRKSPIVPLMLLLALILLPKLGTNTAMFLLPILPRLLNPSPDSPLGNFLLPILGRGDADLATRMAYLPPLEQHYAFEQLNERYYRDWGAYRKAFATNPMVAASSSTASGGVVEREAGGSGKDMASLLSSLMRKSGNISPSESTSDKTAKHATKYPHEYNNGTVIVLDMTKLDSRASKMDTIRDQISFLIHLVGHEEPSSLSQKAGDVGQKSESNVPINVTDIAASAANSSDTTTAQLRSNEPRSSSTTNTPTVEVIVLLESPGGGVSEYGLAASHLQRLRSAPNVKLTICVDSVAASGGYMMACMSSPGQLYCAPFAMVGSIGVIGQSLNVQKTLEGYGVRPYVFRGGRMKNPVGTVGDVTKDGVVAMQEMIDRIHGAFRDHVASAREEAFVEALLSDAVPKPAGNYFQLGGVGEPNDAPSPNIEHVMDQVATGDVFLGVQALKLGLVDRLITSDEYIAEKIRQGSRVLKLIHYHRPGLFGSAHGRRHPSAMNMDGVVSILKRAVYKMTSALIAWAEDGMSATSSIPSISAGSVVEDLQIH